jgi:hypothetical protein
MMLACDGGTGIPFPFFLTNKEAKTSTGVFRKFHQNAELQTGKKMKYVCFDMGGEFDHKTFAAYCEEHGITMEKIPKASSAANGHVEWMNRTIIEGVRTMLLDVRMDRRWWAEAAVAQCYVRGFIPSSRHPDIIPWDRWFNRNSRSDVSHLRVWGSTCWVTDLDHVEGKLGAQAWKGRMVGYMGRRSYRVYDLERRAVYEVRNVTFEEGISHRIRLNIEEPEADDPGTIFNTPDIDNDGLISVDIKELPDQNEDLHPSQEQDDPADHVSPLLRVPIDVPMPAPNVPPPHPPIIPHAQVPQPIQRPRRVPKPTEAVLRSRMYLEREAEARRSKEDWAWESHTPRASMACVIEDYDVESPYIALASVLKGDRDHRIPRNFREAMKDKETWMPAMQKEVDQLRDKGVYRLVPVSEVPEGVSLIDNMWVYDLKLDGNGDVIKHKARLVARGDEMMEGHDFNAKWAMVARMESVRMVMAIAAMLRLHVKQWDFLGAYLNGQLDHPIYMKQPKGFVKLGEENMVCLLLRPLYGLIQAGHIWYNLLAEGYKDLGYRVSKADPCIRIHKQGSDFTITSTHTDDVFGASSSMPESN